MKRLLRLRQLVMAGSLACLVGCGGEEGSSGVGDVDTDDSAVVTMGDEDFLPDEVLEVCPEDMTDDPEAAAECQAAVDEWWDEATGAGGPAEQAQADLIAEESIFDVELEGLESSGYREDLGDEYAPEVRVSQRWRDPPDVRAAALTLIRGAMDSGWIGVWVQCSVTGEEVIYAQANKDLGDFSALLVVSVGSESASIEAVARWESLDDEGSDGSVSAPPVSEPDCLASEIGG